MTEDVEFVVERQIGGTFTVEADGLKKEYRLDEPEQTLADIEKDFGVDRDGAATLLNEAREQSAVDNELARQAEVGGADLMQSETLKNDIPLPTEAPPLPDVAEYDIPSLGKR